MPAKEHSARPWPKRRLALAVVGVVVLLLPWRVAASLARSYLDWRATYGTGQATASCESDGRVFTLMRYDFSPWRAISVAPSYEYFFLLTARSPAGVTCYYPVSRRDGASEGHLSLRHRPRGVWVEVDGVVVTVLDLRDGSLLAAAGPSSPPCEQDTKWSPDWTMPPDERIDEMRYHTWVSWDPRSKEWQDQLPDWCR